METTSAACLLCRTDGGVVVVRARRWRIVLAEEPHYPALTRVVWNAHVAEMSDLDDVDRASFFDAVVAVERTQRRVLLPDKVNLASLGNQVPHLHWHVVPRWRDDAHFPDAIWGVPVPDAVRGAARSSAVRASLDAYLAALRSAFGSR